jgi:hypothetical protein
MTLRRFGLAVFALALAAAAVQVPACEFDPTSPPSNGNHATIFDSSGPDSGAPDSSGPAALSARVLTPAADQRA